MRTFFYGIINKSIYQELSKHLDVKYAIHSVDGIYRDQSNKDLVINNLAVLPSVQRSIEIVFFTKG